MILYIPPVLAFLIYLFLKRKKRGESSPDAGKICLTQNIKNLSDKTKE